MPKNSILIILISILLFVSCNGVNPINSAIEKTNAIFVKKADNKDMETMPVKKGSIELTPMLLAQNDNNNENEGVEDTTQLDIEEVEEVFSVETYSYKTKYNRDPFISVLELQREAMNEFEVQSASYYGMIQGKSGKMALFKDATGLGYVFFEGQKIKNGVLLKIEPDSVIFKLSEYGTVRTKVIRLKPSLKKK